MQGRKRTKSKNLITYAAIILKSAAMYTTIILKGHIGRQ